MSLVTAMQTFLSELQKILKTILGFYLLYSSSMKFGEP